MTALKLAKFLGCTTPPPLCSLMVSIRCVPAWADISLTWCAGSVMVSGSNPNPDYTVGPNVKYPTEYRTELFFPSYYNQRRPQPRGLLAKYSYGGPPFDISLDAKDLFNDISNVDSAKVVIIRTGFSTHSMNMGQRYVELETSYTAFAENSTVVLHVSQLPPNPAIIAPGPAFIFVVVKGVPSVGVQVMLGSGKLGRQPILPSPELPSTNLVSPPLGLSRKITGASLKAPIKGWISLLCPLLASVVLWL